MDFTFDAYRTLLTSLKSHRFVMANYHNWSNFDRPVILRHDIDYDIETALRFADFEADIGGKSTYFIIITSDFYNVFSKKNVDALKKILTMGHEIGLHFDEKAYPEIIGNVSKIIEKIIVESRVLEYIVESPITTVSMHRPSKKILDANIQISNMVNSYSNIFFEKFKYLSDSRRNWREPIEKYISECLYDKMHILTHPFWYKKENSSLKKTIVGFVNGASYDRYRILSENITGLNQIMNKNEIIYRENEEKE